MANEREAAVYPSDPTMIRTMQKFRVILFYAERIPTWKAICTKLQRSTTAVRTATVAVVGSFDGRAFLEAARNVAHLSRLSLPATYSALAEWASTGVLLGDQYAELAQPDFLSQVELDGFSARFLRRAPIKGQANRTFKPVQDWV
jgi:hypothetical protein